MTIRAQPLFASEATAAKLLDLQPKRFRELVTYGALPGPCRIGEVERWDVEELKAIVRGKRPAESQELEL